MPFKRISADEAKAKLDRRKEHLRSTASGMAVVKAMKSPPSWDPDKRSARFVMSSESVDRYRDIVVQAGIDTMRFMENPQALMFHNSRSWPIGNWSDVQKILNGRPRRTEGQLNFMAEGMEPDADRAAVHVQAGTIRTVSIGFIPNWDEVELITDEEDQWTGGFRYPESELVECSLVPIPAQPDALVKDAGGDMVMAKELIEDVLENWAKTPEGLLLPRAEFEAKHLDIVGERSTYFIDKALVPPPPAPNLEVAVKAGGEVGALVGAQATFDQNHADNKGWPFDKLVGAKGTVIESYVVGDDPVHALTVEFLTEDFQGMFRGIRADRFFLADVEEPTAEEPAAPERKDVDERTAEEVREITDDVIDSFAGQAQDGDTIAIRNTDETRIVIERDGQDIDELVMPDDMSIADVRALRDKIAAKTKPAEKSVGSVTARLTLDTSEAEAELERVGKLADGVFAKIGKIFGIGRKESDERIEPTVDTPPSPEAIAAAKARAGEELGRLREAGRI